MDFYSNENFPLPVVEKLRAAGHNVLTIQESGKANQSLPDQAVLDFAREQKRVLLTEPPPLHSASRELPRSLWHSYLQIGQGF